MKKQTACALLLVCSCLTRPAVAVPDPTVLDLQVVDAAGSPLQGAVVSLTDLTRAHRMEARTDPSGRPRFASVPAGAYRLRVALPGFQPHTLERLHVEPGRTMVLTLALQVEGRREEVTVVARSPLVTGTALDVPLAETPVTGGAVTADLIVQQGAATLTETLRNIAGGHARVDYGGYESYTFRGTSGDLDNVLLVDGVRQEGNRVNAALSHVERVEVLRGPASVLYGNDAFGGAVNLVRRRPMAERRHDLALSAGSWSDYRAEGGTTGRLAGGLLYRLDVGLNASEGFRGGRPRRLNLSPVVSWAPDARSLLHVRYTFARTGFEPDGGVPVALIGDERVPRERQLNSPNDFSLARDHSLLLSYTRQVSGTWQLENTLSLRRFDDEYFGAESYSVQDDVVSRSALYFLHDRRPLMNRLRWSGTFDLGARHRFLAGYDYQRYTSDTDRSAFVPIASLRLSDLVDPEPSRERLPTARWIRFRQHVHAVYAQDHVDLGSRFKILAGIRLDRYGRRSRTDPVTAGVTTPGAEVRRDLDAVTWRTGAVLRAGSAYSVYGSVSTAFRPNLQVPFDGRVLEPERGRQWELGQRLEVPGGGLGANLALYQLEKRNVTFARIGNVFDQAGRVEARGVELDVEARPLPGLLVSCNYAFTDARFENFLAGGQDLTGHRPRNVPRHTANLWASHRFGPFGLAAGAQYVGRAWADNGNSVGFGNYALVDAAAFWRRGRIEVRLNLANLLDRRGHFTSAIYDTQLYPGAPRSVLLSLRAGR